MSNLSREAARGIIDSIKEDNGGISPADREATPPSVLRSLANVRRKFGAATKTLAVNLYSKDTRFVYELIQNAEDNQYTQAAAEENEPYITFSLYPDRIVIDSNEDGFTESNVKAICSTGESTKTITQGYIGEKGIGFKSVFKVACKVHIQSGPFSFFFEHRRNSDDDGLGMVTPINEPHRDLPHNVRTRITLTLLNPDHFDQRVRELRQLPDTLLLFLKKLKVITQAIHFADGTTEVVKHTYGSDDIRRLEKLIKTVTSSNGSKETISLFHLTRRKLENLPTDEARKHTNEAEVVLAFPVNEDTEPIIHQQHVFAYLPLRNAGFTFLIQSDFITQASREDVFQSPWNQAILAGVAQAFRDAVLEFYTTEFLQYQWMRYLPSDSISDDFWKGLGPQIYKLLKDTPILRPRSETCLRLPRQLRYVLSCCYDEHNQPLFQDLNPEIYLSPNYLENDLEPLRKLGLEDINMKEWLDIVEADLKSSISRMKTTPTTNVGWHTRIAYLLSTPFHRNFATNIDRVRQFPLIPLGNGSWEKEPSENNPIFFPDHREIPIPIDLGLRLVDTDAVQNTSRKELFSYLKVQTSPSSSVIRLITTRYSKRENMTMENSISHIKFLYWKLPADQADLDDAIWLMDRDDERVRPSEEYIYFQSEEEYGTKELLEEIDLGYSYAPGYPVHFLNSAYIRAVSAEANHNGKSWMAWLESIAKIRSFLQLTHIGRPHQLSNEFKYVIEHRPEKLVGLLEQYWSSYESLLTTDIAEEVSKSKVPSENGTLVSLEQSYLPLPNLKNICQVFEVADFPFLQAPSHLSDTSIESLSFLRRLKVRVEENLDFYTTILERLRVANSRDSSLDDLENYLRVYREIEQNCHTAGDREWLQNHFRDNPCIYMPRRRSNNTQWITSKECVWKGPDWLEIKQPLEAIDKYREFEQLFHVVLRIPNSDLNDSVSELKESKRKGQEDTNKFSNIYLHLWRQVTDWDTIRNDFERYALIYHPLQKSWHPLSSCVWADDSTRIPRKFSIATIYSRLEDFFVGRLRVPKPNLDMHIQALKELADGNASIEEIKDAIRKVSLMEPSRDALVGLQASKIFPVKFPDGRIRLESIGTDFAIIDRFEYGVAFEGKVSVLNCTLEEVREYRSFLLPLGLGERYMSKIIEEKSMVTGGDLHPRLSDEFRRKAYALFRCAVHFNSPKAREGDRSLYFLLLTTSIFKSDGISKSLTLTQGRQSVSVESTKANFHLEQVDDRLHLYVPRNRRDREVCYIRQLPRNLLDFIKVQDPNAESIISGIICSSVLDVVDEVLKDAGIIEVPGVNRPNDANDDQDSARGENEDVETVEVETSQSANLARVQPSTAINGISVVGSVADGGTPSPRGQYARRSISSSSSSGIFTPPLSSVATEPQGPPFVPFANQPHHQRSQSPQPTASAISSFSQYAALLDRIINAASRVMFPTRGTFDFGALRDALPSNLDFQLPLETENETRLGYLPFGVRSMNQIAHDMKIGAAGELFVFELLMNLSLPQFTLANWRSTIRHEVRAHHKYRTIEQWIGSETADIVYEDTSSTFTNFLIGQGYLPAETWTGATPEYFLEVKTTLKGCAEKFWVSKNQYARMQRMRLEPGRAARKVYAVLRVFNLDSRDIGLRVYLDPETLKTDGVLEFTAESYSVKPSNAGGFD